MEDLKTRLQNAVKDAMRAKDRVKLDTYRGTLSALQYEEMQKGVDKLPDTEITSVIQREIKKRKEELEFAEKGGRADLKEKLDSEIAALQDFLPKQLSATELEKIIGEIKAAHPGVQLGVVMKALQEQHAGSYEPKLASEIARKLLA